MLFCVFRDIMARIDWLGDMGTGFGKAVLGIALNFGVFFASCPGWRGWTGEDGGAQRTARIWRGEGGQYVNLDNFQRCFFTFPTLDISSVRLT